VQEGGHGRGCLIGRLSSGRQQAGIAWIRAHEDWLYLAAVLDLFSRQVVG
jgi:hypothetical protein